MLARAFLIGLVLLGFAGPLAAATSATVEPEVCISPERVALEAIQDAPGAFPADEIRGPLAARALDDFRTQLANADSLLPEGLTADQLIWLLKPDEGLLFLVIGRAGCTVQMLRLRAAPGDPS